MEGDSDFIAQVFEPKFHLAGLGRLVASERAPIYLMILSALADFRSEHELEPLNDDLYVRVVERLGEPYETTLFQQDITQLKEWGIILERIEKERLRGYRDNRRAKFRLSPVPQAMAFLAWIGDGLLHAEDGWDDARSHFDALMGVLNATTRTINKTSSAQLDDEVAEELIGSLLRLSMITQQITEGLTRLNLRLLRFTDAFVPDDETEALLDELRGFLERYLRKLSTQRAEAVGKLMTLASSKYRERWNTAYNRIQSQRTTRIFRQLRLPQIPVVAFTYLLRFYESDGQLDVLCRRILRSVRDVWGRLYRELKEARRRSHRLEDLQLLAEGLAKQSDCVAVEAIGEFMRPLICLRDAQVWDGDMLKARPPIPPERGENKKRLHQRPTLPSAPKPTDHPISSRKKRLEALAQWMKARGIGGGYLRFEPKEEGDFHRILELFCVGLLQQGRDLRHEPFHMRLTQQNGEEVFTLETGKAQMTLRTPMVTLEHCDE